MVGGYGAGSAIVTPIAQLLFETVGWRMTFRILGVVLFLMCMVGTMLLKNPPAGYKPEGWTPTPAPERSERDIPTKEVLGLPGVLLPLGRFLFGHDCGAHDDQPTRTAC